MANIVGVGSTKFDEHWEYGLRDLIKYAADAAVKSANISIKDVDTVFISNCFASKINGQNNLNVVCSEETGVQNTILLGGDTGGSNAIIQAANAIRGRQSKIALVVGVEKMSDLPAVQLTSLLSESLEQEHESSKGATLASMYAMMALRHMKEYGTTEKQLDMVSVKNHENALHNDTAYFRFKVGIEDVAKSPMIASPLRLLHSTSFVDGCSCIVMCNDEIAANYKEKIRLLSSGSGADFMAVSRREDMTTFKSLSHASKIALNSAGLKTGDISFAELYDIFSIAEIMSIESIGFAKKGQGGRFIEEGLASLEGNIPINPSGGLKGCGHPYGATPIRQAAECFYQLNNMAGKRQVKNAKYGMACTLSGTGGAAVAGIFGR